MPGTKKLASMVLIFFMTISGASAQRLVSVGPQVGSLGERGGGDGQSGRIPERLG